jgi:hypothetical protein
VNYFVRYRKLRRTDYQIHPLTPINWIISNIITMIFMVASGNLALVISGALALVFQVIFLALGVAKNRRLKNIKWKIKFEDYIFFAFAVLATITYYFLDDLNLAALIVLIGSCFGEIPQLRKDFAAPHTDSAQIYIVVAIRYVVAFGTLSNIDFVGLSTTLYWAIFSFAEALWVVYCQKRQNLLSRKFATAEVNLLNN